MKSLTFLLVFVFAISLFSCIANKNTNTENETSTENKEEQMTSLEEAIEKAFNDAPYKSIKNKDKSHTLCISPSQDKNYPFIKTFLVHNGEKIVYKPKRIRGEVKWEDNFSVSVIKVLGIPRKDGNMPEPEIITVVLKK